MSASSKKKLRKEQNVASMTERQIQEQKEAKKLARITVIFVVIMALLITAGVGVLLRNPVNTLINRNTHALTIGEHEINAVELNYYYADAVADFYNNLKETYDSQANLYAQWYLGVDFSSSLDEQTYDETTGQSWGDYFVQVAKANAKSIYAMYNKAIADNHKVSESEQENIDIIGQSLEFAAQTLGYSSTDSYVSSLYGPGSDVESYTRYFEMNAVATSYYIAHQDSLKYEDSDFREYETDKYNDFSCYSYASYTLGMSTYIKGGTTAASGDIIYTDEERAAALAAAKVDADALVAGTYESVDDFDKAIAALAVNKDKKNVKSTQTEDIFFNDITNEDVQTWVSDPERKAGDMTIVEAKNVTTDADGKETSTVTGYYVIYFQEEQDNTMPLANVRHLLVKFEGGTKDDKGNTVYSDAEKAAAEKEAKELYEQWKSGEKVDADSFAALAKEKSDDTGTKSNGGLIEDITPADSLVENFLNWCFDDRKAGDSDVIETEYGFHLMYYVEDDEMTYRDTLIKAELIDRDMASWLEELEKAYPVTDVNLSRVYYDFIPS